MSNTDPNAAFANSRDCGTFFIDVAGHFTRQQVEIHWADQPRPTDAATERAIEETWQAQSELARPAQRKLYNGQLCRLVNYSGGQMLSLTVGPVTYREFVGTNLFNARLRYSQGPEVLANPLGVSAAVTTTDGFIVLALRSNRVAFHANRIHPIGGMVQPPSPASPPPHPYDAMLTELTEETGMAADRVRQMLCLGMVRDKSIVQPELIFDVDLDVDVPQLRQGHQVAVDGAEHADLMPVRNLPASVVEFIRGHFDQLTPVALAALLLHGSRRWGTGWFTAARGFLRRVL